MAMELPFSFDPDKGMEETIDQIESYLKLPLEDKTPSGYGIREDCRHLKVYLDAQNRTVTCQDCKKQLDPFWYLQLLAKEWRQRRYADAEAVKAYREIARKEKEMSVRGRHFARPTSGRGQYYWDVFTLLNDGHEPDFIVARGATWYVGQGQGVTHGDYCAALLADKYKRMGLPPPDILKQPT